jgi:asparagine synthase (glutamine-hydrolysing)
MTPRDKAASRFLSALQMELDPELGRIPLEGRPAPIAYAQPNLRSSARRTMSTARRAASKARQRLRRGNRAPAGGSTLTKKIVEHWRLHPELVLTTELPAFFSRAWIEGVLDGRVEPEPSSVAFLTNLLVARRPLDT